jgi:hypothetical protein
MSANLLLHSLANFREFILPALELAGARRIVEIGSEYGTFTRELCNYAVRVDGRFASIDPKPQPAALEFVAANRVNPHFQFIQATSIEALSKLEAADAWIVDGDHNYHTVFSELQLIDRACGGKPVLIFEHDVCWPCGRRDMYYNPGTIPPASCHPYTHKEGVMPDNPGIVPGGFRGEGALAFATHEGGKANGVSTAIEDFVAKHPCYRYEIIPAIFGLGIVYNADAPWAGKLSAHLQPWTRNPLLPIMERNRLDLYLKVIELQDRLSAPPARPQPQAPILSPAIFNQKPK